MKTPGRWHHVLESTNSFWEKKSMTSNIIDSSWKSLRVILCQQPTKNNGRFTYEQTYRI